MNISWHSTEQLEAAVRTRLVPAGVLVDIGCGIRPQRLVTPVVHVCCEPFADYARRLQDEVISSSERTFLVLGLTWKQALDVLPEKSVDSVFLLDVIEHLEKEEGAELLRRTERLARRQVVLFTPLGFVPQVHPDGIDAWGMRGGAWQEHKSGWNPEDFDESWEILASRAFHTTDSLGKPLAEPAGAFFAVKTFSEVADVPRRRLAREVFVEAMAVEDPETLRRGGEVFRDAVHDSHAFVRLPRWVAAPRRRLAALIRRYASDRSRPAPADGERRHGG